MKVDELIALGGVPPRTPSSPPSADVFDEITRLYNEVYVRGLTLFFETRWFELQENLVGSSNSILDLHHHQHMISLFTSFIQSIIDVKSMDPADMVYSSHLEACVVWALASLPAIAVSNGVPPRHVDAVPAEDDVLEARNRVLVFETLLSGGTLPSNPLSFPRFDNISTARRHELEFWYNLAEYLLDAHASSSPSDVSGRAHCLGVLRSLLDGRENRDVLYSIVVLREYTACWDAASNEQAVPSHLEESDPRSKLAVATRFIRDESASAGGTTNVVRRFADLAYRAFVRPGVNVGSIGNRN